MKREVIQNIFQYFSIEANADHEAYLTALVAELRVRAGKPIFPRSGESLALSVMTPKIAALAFDRVYRIPFLIDPVPEELGFYCATQTELAFWGVALTAMAAKESGIALPIQEDDKSNRSQSNEALSLKFICSEFRSRFAIEPTLFYHSPVSYADDCAPRRRRRVKHDNYLNAALLHGRWGTAPRGRVAGSVLKPPPAARG